MGNKLCAPLLKRNYRGHETNQWHARKDSHLLRLWADVLRFRGDGDSSPWERVSEDVVPVNISCIEDTPRTVFQVTAYNRQVEKIFDVKITQPGTILCPATECFVHWRDPVNHCEWGLNFATPTDAKRFRDSCSFPTQRFARKANSANSLVLSPPKGHKVHGGSSSSPSSPVRHGGHVTPEHFRDKDGREHVEGYPVISTSKSYNRYSGSTPVLLSDHCKGGNIGLQPASHDPAVVHRQKTDPQSTAAVSNPSFRRSYPASGADYHNPSTTMSSFLTSPSSPEAPRIGSPTPRASDAGVAVTSNPATCVSSSSSVSSTPSRSSSNFKYVDAHVRPASAISDLAFQKSNSPKHVQISDIVSVNISDASPLAPHTTAVLGHSSLDKPNGILKRDNRNGVAPGSQQSEVQTSFISGLEETPHIRVNAPSASPTTPDLQDPVVRPQKKSLKVDTSLPVPPHNSASESPEWPSPPEPLTPQTPQTPNGVDQIHFDSATIQRMLRSLPSSPTHKTCGDEADLGFHEESTTSDQTEVGEHPVAVTTQDGRRGSRLSRAKSLPMFERLTKASLEPTRQQSVDTHLTSSAGRRAEGSRPRMFNKLALERELRRRNKKIAVSYPDSGMGVSTDTAPSVRSEGSLHFLRTGADVSQDLKSSWLEAATSSRASVHSDVVSRIGQGSEVKPYLAPDFSDEEDDLSDRSIDTMIDTESQLSFAQQAGATRKAGWLVVKNWLIHKKKKIELAPHRTWKKYWVCLKGTTLLFFDCDEESSITGISVPRHILVIEGGISQAVPEHPKRENIFSLSTACGDAYLFQASSQMELDNWIRAIHSACASSYARQHGKDNTLKLLSSELQKVESSIDMDGKMRKMAELQMSVVTDPKSRQAILKQIAQWEENLEKLYVDQYRFRCYCASLQGSELPNPKVLLANASKVSKTTLGRLGIFTVTSFHALVSARKPLVLPNIYGKTSHKGGMLSPRSEVTQKPRSQTPTALVSSSISYDSLPRRQPSHSDSLDNLNEQMASERPGQESLSQVTFPKNQRYNFQTMLIGVDRATTVQDLLEMTCSKRQLNPNDHYVRIKPLGSTNNTFIIPDQNENIKKLRYEAIEVCQKCIFQLELTKPTKDGLFGFAVEAELAEDFDREDELRVYVCDVTWDGVADKQGLIVGDEVLTINGKIVSELDMVYIETLLHESRTLFLTVRSMRTQPPHVDFLQSHADAYINNMMVPPPPSQTRLSEKSLGSLIVPAPASDNVNSSASMVFKERLMQSQSSVHIDALLKGAEEVTALCQKDVARSLDDPVTKPLSEAQRLRKAVLELVETERAYVKDLRCLIDRYLVPLKEETFLTSGDIEQLFGNIQEIVAFQQRFLRSLEEAVESVADFFVTEDISDFKRVLFSVGGSFLNYANHFKVYSSFCASHSRSQKILNPDANETLREFLRARNPKQQHSATLESYLIKPIQRILKYPLLLQQLCNMTHTDTDEQHHLSEALKGMEAVAEHINEMQKIYDEYGTVFDELVRAYRDVHPHKPLLELNVGDLQMYGTVEWVNLTEHLGKVKKSAEFENIVFVFKTGVTFLSRERLRKKKLKPVSSRSSMMEVTETVERYRTLIPTQEVQIRPGKVGDMDGHYWWDLIHARSEVEGRPERVYQFCNSTSEAKVDFMKVIKQTIKDSVRITVTPAQPPTETHSPDQPKLSSLSVQSTSSFKQNPSCPHLTIPVEHIRVSSAHRHSMELDNKFGDLNINLGLGERSKTCNDLLGTGNESSEGLTVNSKSVTSASLRDVRSFSVNSSISFCHSNNLGCSSATLLYSSTDPLHYSSSSGYSTDKDGRSSPVWKRASGRSKPDLKPRPRHLDRNRSFKLSKQSRKQSTRAVYVAAVADTAC